MTTGNVDIQGNLGKIPMLLDQLAPKVSLLSMVTHMLKLMF